MSKNWCYAYKNNYFYCEQIQSEMQESEHSKIQHNEKLAPSISIVILNKK